MGWSWITIPRSFFTEEAVLEVSPLARLVYVGIHVVADEHGRFRAGPRSIANAVGLHGEDVTALLCELEGQRLFFTYEVDGAAYGIIRGYDRRLTGQQRARRPKPAHPEPPANVLEDASASPGEARASKGVRHEVSRNVMTEDDMSRNVTKRHEMSRLDKTRQDKTKSKACVSDGPAEPATYDLVHLRRLRGLRDMIEVDEGKEAADRFAAEKGLG